MIKPIAHSPQEWALFGIVAVVFLVGIVVLLRLILADVGSMRRATLPSKQFRRILLPAAAGADYSEASLRLACRLAERGSNGLLLTYIIEVPRSLAPDASMPEEEEEARQVLSRAGELVRRQGIVPTTKIRRGRAAVEEMLRAIREEKADLLLLPMTTNPRDVNVTHPFQGLTAELAQKAPCEVVLARTPVVEEAAS